MRIIAESYTGEDKAEFYRFVRALDALKNSMKGEKTVILPGDSEIAKILSGKNLK